MLRGRAEKVEGHIQHRRVDRIFKVEERGVKIARCNLTFCDTKGEKKNLKKSQEHRESYKREIFPNVSERRKSRGGFANTNITHIHAHTYPHC